MRYDRLFLLAFAVILLACRHQAPAAGQGQPARGIMLRDGTSTPAGTRIAIQFNDEPPIVQVATGRGGFPIVYHGQELSPDRISSIVVLKGPAARERFKDETLDAAILIELK